MNYYLARECPYPLPMRGDVIGFDRTTAETWNVKYIMKTNSIVPNGILYKEADTETLVEDGSSFYLQISDADTFNMLDAFNIPHLDAEDHKITYSKVIPQLIANRDGSRTITIDKNTKDVKGPKGQVIIYPSLHMMNKDNPNETANIILRPLTYDLRIGDLLVMPDNTVQKII